MREGWKTERFDNVFELQMGKTPSRNNPAYFSGDNVWVSIADLKEKYISDSKEYISNEAVSDTGIAAVPANTVIMSFKLSVGKCAITTKELYTNEAIMSFRPKVDYSLIPDFIYYYLKGYHWQGANKAVMGITLNKKSISNNKFSFPPLSTQQQIVEELDLLNGIIEKQKAQLKELDTLAQSLFYDMFGDPVTNEKGWKVKKLGEVCTEIKYGTSLPACANGRYKYLRMCNLTNDGYLDLTDIKTIDIPDSEIEKCIVKYGDILFNRTNSIELVGKTCMFDQDEPMVIAGYIIRVRLNQELLPVVIARMFNMPSVKKFLRGMAKGAVNQANINSKELASINIPLPPLTLQQQFAERVASIEHQKSLVKQSLKETETLFNSRMDYYFN